MDEFPATSATRVALAAAPGRRARHAGGKILLAEGNRLNQKIAARILESEGLLVTTVTTGEQVLAALRESTFDLILMDPEMPVMSGFEAASIIRENEAATAEHIPIVAMTSSDAQGDRCLQSGMDQYIAQPLNQEQLRRTIALLVPAADAEPAFDLAAALSRVGGDQAFLSTLATMFLEDAPTMIADIRVAVEQQDATGLARAAHKVKGAASPFFFSAVTDAARTLESMGESGQLTDAASEHRRFEAAIGALLVALTALSHRADGPKAPSPTGISATKGTIPCTA